MKENTSKKTQKEKLTDKNLMIIAEMSLTKLHLIHKACAYARDFS